jgi:acyl-coenzyme A thioesterase PaaI-like protein
MRGTGPIGRALGLGGRGLQNRMLLTSRNLRRSSGSGGTSPGSPSMSHGTSIQRQLITAGLGGGVIGSIAGLAVGHKRQESTASKREEEQQRSELQRLKSLRKRAIEQEQEQSSVPVHSARDAPWYATVSENPDHTKILDAATLLQSDHPFLEDDHMFSAFLARGIINDIEGYYNKGAKEFNAVVALGKDVSGYAGIVHGGLTAAIFDEVFGGLLFCTKTRHLKLNLLDYIPSFTVNLEVNYQRRISAGSTVLCRAWVDRIEGRKLFMRAELRDGPEGKVYAESKAIFVRPRLTSLFADLWSFLMGGRKE